MKTAEKVRREEGRRGEKRREAKSGRKCEFISQGRQWGKEKRQSDGLNEEEKCAGNKTKL